MKVISTLFAADCGECFCVVNLWAAFTTCCKRHADESLLSELTLARRLLDGRAFIGCKPSSLEFEIVNRKLTYLLFDWCGNRARCQCGFSGKRRVFRGSALLDVLEHCRSSGHVPVGVLDPEPLSTGS